MPLRAEEITSILSKELQSYESKLEVEDVGTVLKVGDGIATIYGLLNAMAGELLEFPGGLMGMVLNLEESSVGVAIFGDDSGIKEGDLVKRTGNVASIPVSRAMLGRIVTPLGEPIDGKGPITGTTRMPIEAIAPNVLARQPVREPLMTGIKAIDSMIPIGRGQRELIIGDRQTGKTAIAIDTIINQKGKGVVCVYVAVGQKMSGVVRIANTLERNGALEHTVIVVASADEAAAFQYIAPYAGCAVGEYFRDRGEHALCVYDDLSKQAVAYRQMSLLLRRPPGREAYPGDVFYLHSRLLERAARLHNDLGGGSLTALPIIETQAGDVSAYIPTNVISITDGQIFLEPDLFYQGIRPAVNAGISVSRVGGNAQTKAMKKVGGQLRIAMAQFRELAAFAQFGSDLDAATQAQLTRGERLVEVLKQPQYEPMSQQHQVLQLFAGAKGLLDSLPSDRVIDFCGKMIKFAEKEGSDLLHEIETVKDISADLDKKLYALIERFKVGYMDELEQGKSSNSVDLGNNSESATE